MDRDLEGCPPKILEAVARNVLGKLVLSCLLEEQNPGTSGTGKFCIDKTTKDLGAGGACFASQEENQLLGPGSCI